VYSDMLTKVDCLCETLKTNFTHVRTLSSVCSYMVFQILQ
jgi:hypothetical protein